MNLSVLASSKQPCWPVSTCCWHSPSTTAIPRWFAQQLLHNPNYRNAFEHVVFAVLDRKGASLAAFEAQFIGEESK
ncbi:hypothetical protein SAMN05518865_111184 [Duganella sp. CF458]|nr:hypothetical protein SAMN05518865_111184 [Duganella sp. CF458]